MNSKELKKLGELSPKEQDHQAESLAQYISKFPLNKYRQEIERWMESKDFETYDAIQIMLILFMDKLPKMGFGIPDHLKVVFDPKNPMDGIDVTNYNEDE